MSYHYPEKYSYSVTFEDPENYRYVFNVRAFDKSHAIEQGENLLWEKGDTEYIDEHRLIEVRQTSFTLD